MKPKPGKSFLNKLFRSAGMVALGFAAAAIPLHLLLRKQLVDAPEDIRAQGWPIRLMQVLFAKYVLRWIDVEGLENLPQGSYLVAANHAYKSGVDGFILGHLLATRARRVPRIVITADNRTWVVRSRTLGAPSLRDCVCWWAIRPWESARGRRIPSPHTFGRATAMPSSYSRRAARLPIRFGS